MNRREAVKNVAFLMGSALSATTIATFFDSCNQPGKNSEHLLSSEQEKLIAEIADTILPTTKQSPGAKAAGVGSFIVMMIKECYPEDAQIAFVNGLATIEETSKKLFSKNYIELDATNRNTVIAKLRDETLALIKEDKDKTAQAEKLEQETKGAKPEKEKAGNPMAFKETPKTKPLFFPIIRDLTLLGFFTSEIGATKAYEFVEIPGRYDGCVDLKPGQRVWA